MRSLADFVDLVNRDYLQTYNTRLIGGYAEPLYVPPQALQPAQIRFTQDYFRSALHELAHWCVAGHARRQLEDYGYWYAPAAVRTPSQQAQFFNYEVVPQAFEWALSLVCEIKFDVSVDNFNPDPTAVLSFKSAVRECLARYLVRGFPERTETLLRLLYPTSPREALYASLSDFLSINYPLTDK